MTTLTDITPLLNHLFEYDANSWRTNNSVLSELSEEERKRLIMSKTEYLEFYGHMKDMPLAVSRETGTFLYMLARSTKAKNIIEFGTSFGISTLHLAAAIRDNGGGHLITTEFEPSKIVKARENLTSAGLIDLVDLREGDALKTLASNLPETIDLVLLDGAKSLYLDILNLLESKLSIGALIIADNANFEPSYLEKIHSKESGYLSVPFRDDVEISIKIN